MTERLLYAVRSVITYRPSQPTRDEAYKRFIRTFPCVVCQSRWTEAAHTGPHGLGQKSDDFSCIPLCREHHRTGLLSYHRLGRVKFEKAHRLDVAALIGMFQGWWGELALGMPEVKAELVKPGTCEACGAVRCACSSCTALMGGKCPECAGIPGVKRA